jgi:hypothetical protein
MKYNPIQSSNYLTTNTIYILYLSRSRWVPGSFVGHVTDVVAASLQLNDVTFLQRRQLGVSQHLQLHLHATHTPAFHTCLYATLTPPEERTYLGVAVDVLLEVLLLIQDRFGDDVVVVETQSCHRGSFVYVSQPRDLLRLLVVLSTHHNCRLSHHS